MSERENPPLEGGAEAGVKMVVLRCPNCGGELRVEPGTTRARCEHCKTSVLIIDQTKGTANVDRRDVITPEQEEAARRIIKFTLFGTAISVMLPIVITVIVLIIVGLAFLAIGLASIWLVK
jgi:DNA-directed RNA polymerase subunit RPC12/RpoP